MIEITFKSGITSYFKTKEECLPKLKEFIFTYGEIANIENMENSNKCPECGDSVVHQSGCFICPSCFYSPCK